MTDPQSADPRNPFQQDHGGDSPTRCRDSERIAADRNRRESLSWSKLLNREAATWVGLLVDLAEGQHSVRVQTRIRLDSEGRALTIRGRVTGVGSDVVVVTGADSTTWIVRMNAVSSVSPDGTFGAANGDRALPSDAISMALLLREMTDERRSAQFYSEGGAVRGELRSCGIDVCSVASTNGWVHFPIQSIDALCYGTDEVVTETTTETTVEGTIIGG